MKISAKFPIEVFRGMVGASAALFAQGSGSSPVKPQSLAGVLGARQIADPPVAATERI